MTTAKQTGARNPFPGPQPYRASDRDRFYGREELAYHLEGYILANACVTVYGPSGAGKSSLVQAAVVPALVDKDGIDVVRVDGWPEDQDPTRWLADAVYADLALGERPKDASPADALVAAAQRAARRSSRIVLVYLDQMEQLLYATRGAKASAEFFDGLSRLVELPMRNLRVVLSLREDYLGRFRDHLRDRRRVLDHGFRVGPMTVGELCHAVCQAAAAGEPPQRWEPDAMRPLMLQVRVPGEAGTDEAEAQSAYAQIVCRALFQERAGGRAGGGEGEAEPILRRYLEATLADLGDLRAAAQQILEDHLVSAEGSRTLRTEKELLRILPAEKLFPILQALESAAILHAEQHQGSRYFEIGHDWLARWVFEQRLAREQAAEERRREEERQRELARARAQRRRLLSAALLSTAVAVGAAGLSAVAYWQRSKALAAEAQAVAARKAADENAIAANDERLMTGYAELAAKGQVAWGIKLLLAVEKPELRRSWVGLANDALGRSPPLVTFQGHKGPLTLAVYSRDGKHVLTASEDGTARVWPALGDGPAVVLDGHTGPVVAAAWSADGARVAVASRDGTARVWAADGKTPPVVLEGHEGPLTAVAFAPDGGRVATASLDGTARVFDVQGAGQAVLRHRGPVRSVSWSADGARVITASDDRAARVWSADGKGFAVTLGGHLDQVIFAAFGPKDAGIVTTSADGTARLFHGDGKGVAVALKGHKSAVTHAAWSPDGLHVATASDDGTARVWGLDGKLEATLEGHAGSVTSVAFHPSGRTVLTASTDGTARVWAVGGQGRSVVIAREADALRSAWWSPDGTHVVTASAGGLARVWSRSALSIPEGAPHAASIGRDGAWYVAADDDRTAVLRRMDGSDERVVFRGDAWVSSAAPSPSGDRVVVATFDKLARVVPADGTGADGKGAVLLAGHGAEVRDAAWSPDGQWVVTASDDRTALVRRADGTGAPVKLAGHADSVYAAAFFPDGKRVVTGSLDNTARVWDAGTGQQLLLLQHDGDVHGVAASPDGKRIATASLDGSARVWDAETGALVRSFKHDTAVLRVAWTRDGARLVTSTIAGTVHLWAWEGSGPDVILGTSARVLATAPGPENEQILAVAADGSTHAWDFAIPRLAKRLAEANLDCLPWELRQLYLTGHEAKEHETKDEAVAAYRKCEADHGREASPEGGVSADRSLGPGEVRVNVTVAPGDARVEVDGRPAVREHGVVSLAGKPGDAVRVHVAKDARICDFKVVLGAAGASPAALDLARCPGAEGAPSGPRLSRLVSAALKYSGF